MLKLLKGPHEAFKLLKKDHDEIKRLFSRFEKAAGIPERTAIVREACVELKAHAAVEEELFYPSLRQRMLDEEGLLEEADEEHHEAKIMIAELELMNGEEPNYCAKFEVLAENVRHHIKEEERRIFRQARRTEIDFEALGERMYARKRELLASGVPPDAETEMVGAFGVVRESPSRKAQRTIDPPLRKRKH